MIRGKYHNLTFMRNWEPKPICDICLRILSVKESYTTIKRDPHTKNFKHDELYVCDKCLEEIDRIREE